jgi:hypothetical protein
MADPTNGATVQATAGIDYEKLGGLITKAVDAAVEARIKPVADAQTKLGEQVAQLASGAAADAGKDKGGKDGKDDKGAAAAAPTLEQIGALIDSKLTAAQQSSQSKAQRDQYMADQLKDLPAAYRNQLGNDPAKWKEEEQAIRDQFKSDLKTAGVETKALGDAARDGGKTPELRPVDRSKLTPLDLLQSDK